MITNYLRRRPKYFRAKTEDGHVFTFWGYRRPLRGEPMEVQGGLYEGDIVRVTWRWSPFYKGYAWRAV